MLPRRLLVAISNVIVSVMALLVYEHTGSLYPALGAVITGGVAAAMLVGIIRDLIA